MLNKLEYLKEEYIIQYIQPLIDLNIPSTCQSIEQIIFSIVHDERFIYKEFFTRERFDTYLEDKKHNQFNELKKIPHPVIPFYELLETLTVVKNTFEELNIIPLKDLKSSISLIPNAWTLIQTNIPDIYLRLQHLSRMHILIHQLIVPICNPIENEFDALYQFTIHSKNHLSELYTLNRESLKQMAPQQKGGLAILTKLVLLTPYLLQELTQYIERGDPKINFDPLSSKIIKLEDIYVKALQAIADPNQTTLQGLIKLLQVLPRTISNILKELMSTSKASAKKLTELKEKLVQTLDKIQLELETIEENIGLKRDTLVEPYLPMRNLLIEKVTGSIVTLNDLPEQLKPYAKITNIMRMDLKSIIKPNSSSNVSKTAETTQPPSLKENEPPALNFIQTNRLERIKNIQILQEKRYNAFREFFLVLEREKKYSHFQSLQSFENLSNMFFKNTYYSLVATIQDLSSNQKNTLLINYPYLQPFFQAQSPQLDAAIIQCLEAKEDKAHIYLPNQGSNLEFIIRFYLMSMIAQFYFTGNTHWICRSFMLMFIGYIYYYPMQNQLDLILKQKKAIEMAIGQQKTHEDHQLLMIKERLPEINIEKHLSLIQPPESVPTIQKPYDSVFTILRRENQLSAQIDNFLEQTLYPNLIKTLSPKILKEILGDDKLPCETLPFPYLPTDDEMVQSYKKLINAFYHLKITLKELESVELHQYSDNRQFIVKASNVITILLPILTSGLQTINDIQNILKNPRLIQIEDDCIHCLLGTYQTLKGEYPSIILPIIIENYDADEPSDAFEYWLKHEDIYQRKIAKNTSNLELPKKKNNQSISVPSTSIKKDENPTTLKYLDQFNQILSSIHEQYQMIFDKNKTLDPDNLAKTAKETSKNFIENLRLLIQDTIYEGNDKKGKESIEFIKEFDWSIKSITKLFTGIRISNIPDTLQFTDGVIGVCQALYNKNKESGVKTILEIYALLSYHLLTMTDDIEVNHLQSGLITIPLQEILDKVFGTVIENIAPEHLFEFWSNRKIFNARAAYQSQKESFAREKYSEQEEFIQRTKPDVDNNFKKLQELLKLFQSKKIEPLKDSSDFKEFLAIYQNLELILIKINPDYFKRASFLKSIHRPEHVIEAISTILKQEELIKAYLHSKLQHQESMISAHLELKENIINNQSDERNKNIINQAIRYLIKDQEKLKLGAHHSYFAEKITQAFWAQEDKCNLNTLYHALNSSDSQAFKEKIKNTIDQLHEHPLQKQIYDILKADHQFNIELNNEIYLAYHTKSNLPSKYQFVKLNEKKISDHEIQIRQGYEIVNNDNSKLELYQISLNSTGEFKLPSLDGSIIQGKLTTEEQSKNDEDKKKIILEKAKLSAQTLFYKTHKMKSWEPVPNDFIEENKINLAEPLNQLIINLQPYINEFLRFSDEKQHTDEVRPCLKQKIKYLRDTLEQGKIKDIPTKIERTLTQAKPLKQLSEFNKTVEFVYQRTTKKYSKEVQYYNQIMFIDDQLERISFTENKAYQPLQTHLRCAKTSPEQRFYQFSMEFKPKKISFFFGAEHDCINLLSKKIWRGAIIVQKLEAIQSAFPKKEQQQIKELIKILKNDKQPFIALDQRLEYFFDLIMQEKYLNLFLTPNTLFERMLAIFGIPNSKQQFIQNLRKDNRLLNLCLTLRENNNAHTEELKKELSKYSPDYAIEHTWVTENHKEKVIYLKENPKTYFIKGMRQSLFLEETIDFNSDDIIKLEIIQKGHMPYVSQKERLKNFKKSLDENKDINSALKSQLRECLPPLPNELPNLIIQNRNKFIADLNFLAENISDFKPQIEKIEKSQNDFQEFKKATSEFNTLLEKYKPPALSSFFTHLIGQKTHTDVVIDKVKKKLNFFKDAEKLKSSHTPLPKK